MEVIETIVIQSAEVEGKETVVSTVDTDKTKAGWYHKSEGRRLSSSHRMKRGGPDECAVSAYCRDYSNKQ